MKISKLTYSPTIDLIFRGAACRLPIEDHTPKVLSEPLQVDWADFLRLVKIQGVAPRVNQWLSYFPSCVPEHVLTELGAYAKSVLFSNLQTASELSRVVAWLDAAGLRVLPFKGVAVAVVFYGHVGMREYGDIDLFTSKHDLEPIRDALLSNGYSLNAKTLTKHGTHRTFQGYELVRKHNHTIDLQDRFGLRYSSFSLDFEDLWKRRIESNVGNRLFFTLSPEDYLLMMCAHGGQHRWAQLKWVCDINELLRATPSFSWDVALDRARNVKATRMVLMGLHLAHYYLGTPLPEFVVETLQQSHQIAAMANRVMYWMFSHPETLVERIRRSSFDYAFDALMRPQLHYVVLDWLFLTKRRIGFRIPNLR